MDEILENETETTFLFDRSDDLEAKVSKVRIDSSAYKDLSVAFPTKKWHPTISLEGANQVVRGIKCAERLKIKLISSFEDSGTNSLDDAIMEVICIVYVDDPLIMPTVEIKEYLELLRAIDPKFYFGVNRLNMKSHEKRLELRRVGDYLSIVIKAISNAQPLPEILNIKSSTEDSSTSLYEERYTTTQAAEYLGVSKKTFSRYCQKYGIEPLPERPGNQHLFSATDIFNISKKR